MGSLYPYPLKNKAYLGCLVLLEIGCVVVSPSLQANSTQTNLTVNQQREQAVQLAKQGNLANGIDTLKQLHVHYPQDAKVTADLIILLRLAGRNAEIVNLTNSEKLDSQVEAMPSYAYTAWLGALRDQKQAKQAFDIAQQVYTLSGKTPFHKAKSISAANATNTVNPADTVASIPFDTWYYATLATEAGRRDVVQQLLTTLEQGNLTAAQYATLAYIQRLSGNWQQSISSSKQALAIDPKQRLALEQQFVALRSSNQIAAAYQLANDHSDIFPSTSILSVKVDLLSLNLQAALKQKEVLEAQGKYPQAWQLVEANLQALKQVLNELNVTPSSKALPEYASIFNDYLYLLRVQEYMPKVVAQYESLSLAKQFQLKPYAKNAVADAYLALKKTKQAHELYAYLLSNSAQPSVELYIADYYALIDQDQYRQASELLKQLDQQVLPIQRSSSVLEIQKRVRVEQMIALDAAYRNRLDVAANSLQQLVQQNPKNTSLANDYATILNWRGLALSSDQVLQQAYINAPYNVALDLSSAANARDLQDYPRWRAAVATAAEKVPNNSGVIKSQQALQDRNRATIQSNLTIGRTSADKQTANFVNGTSERDWNTRINSPWINDHWRVFASHLDRSADLQPTQQRDQRLGLGLEWQQARKNVWLMVDQQRQTDKTGFELGLAHWLNDNWRYRLTYQQNSNQIPLRALESGLDANAYQTGLTWRQNESKSASFGYQLLDISDGNKRQSLSTRYNQRLYANAKHITDGGIEAYYDKNSQSGGNYFNPEHSASYGVNLQHDWLTWHKDQQSFTQHVEVSAGISQQAGFGGKTYANALYQHEWELNRLWQINYGVGWGSQVYDGNREQRTFAKFGLTGTF